MKTPMEFTIGSDPELMIYDRSLDKIISSLSLLPDKRHPVDLGDDIYVYSDNVLVETKFMPVTTKEDFVKTFQKTFRRVKNHLGDNFDIIPVAAHVYDDSELQIKEAWKIGCTPSYSCYSRGENEITPFQDGTRTGSAHIHIGNQSLCSYDMRNLTVRLLDIFVGCASVMFEKDVASSRMRRKLYGRAGEFRPTSYGLEYRVLSPFVLSSPELIELTYDLTDFALSIVESNEIEQTLNLVNPRKIQDIINNCDRRLANNILNDVYLKSEMPHELIQRINYKYNVEDFNRNWQIN